MAYSSSDSHTSRPKGVEAPNPQLIKSIDRFRHSWFPVQAAVLQRIRDGLTSGAYDLSIDFLVSDIQSDFSLFTYCLKELRPALIKHDKPLPENMSPVQMLRYAGKDVLTDILSKSSEEISSHDFSDENTEGLRQIRDSLISAGTADAIGERTSVQESLGYSTALLRQLGLTLIAWNYPKVFERCASNLHEGESLEDKLSAALGFHPQLIPITLARQWQLMPEIRSSLGDSLERDELNAERLAKIENTAHQLTAVCEVGEALARSLSPEVYPSATHDWETAQEEITRIFGEGGLRFIQKKIIEQCEAYRESFPQIFDSIEQLDEEPQHHALQNFEQQHNNKYLRSCSDLLQKKLIEVYRRMLPRKISQDALDLLLKELLPEAGFRSGCVYMLEASTMELRPRIQLGRKLPDGSLTPHHFSNIDGVPAQILEAFSCSTPIIKSRQPGVHGASSSMAFVVSPQQRIGVLYVEISQELENSIGGDALLIFRAFHKAFCDCLNLK